MGASFLQRSRTEAIPAGFATAVQPAASRRISTRGGRAFGGRGSRAAPGKRPISKIVAVSPGGAASRPRSLRPMAGPISPR